MGKRKPRSKANSSPSAKFNQDFEALVQQHTPYLKGVAFSILHNRDDVEEVLQDSLVKAYSNLLSFSEEDKATLQERSWLSTIVRNTACTYLAQKRKGISLDTLSNYVYIGRRYDWPDSAATRREIEKALEEVLAYNTPNEKASLVLHVCEGKSYREIGAMLGIKEATAKCYARTARHRSCWNLEALGVDITDLRAWDCVYEVIADPTTPRSW